MSGPELAANYTPGQTVWVKTGKSSRAGLTQIVDYDNIVDTATIDGAISAFESLGWDTTPLKGLKGWVESKKGNGVVSKHLFKIKRRGTDRLQEYAKVLNELTEKRCNPANSKRHKPERAGLGEVVEAAIKQFKSKGPGWEKSIRILTALKEWIDSVGNKKVNRYLLQLDKDEKVAAGEKKKYPRLALYSKVVDEVVAKQCGYSLYYLPSFASTEAVTLEQKEELPIELKGEHIPQDAQVKVFTQEDGKETAVPIKDVSVSPYGKKISFKLKDAPVGTFSVRISSKSQDKVSTLLPDKVTITAPPKPVAKPTGVQRFSYGQSFANWRNTISSDLRKLQLSVNLHLGGPAYLDENVTPAPFLEENLLQANLGHFGLEAGATIPIYGSERAAKQSDNLELDVPVKLKYGVISHEDKDSYKMSANLGVKATWKKPILVGGEASLYLGYELAAQQFNQSTVFYPNGLSFGPRVALKYTSPELGIFQFGLGTDFTYHSLDQSYVDITGTVEPDNNTRELLATGTVDLTVDFPELVKDSKSKELKGIIPALSLAFTGGRGLRSEAEDNGWAGNVNIFDRSLSYWSFEARLAAKYYSLSYSLKVRDREDLSFDFDNQDEIHRGSFSLNQPLLQYGTAWASFSSIEDTTRFSSNNKDHKRLSTGWISNGIGSLWFNMFVNPRFSVGMADGVYFTGTNAIRLEPLWNQPGKKDSGPAEAASEAPTL